MLRSLLVAASIALASGAKVDERDCEGELHQSQLRPNLRPEPSAALQLPSRQTPATAEGASASATPSRVRCDTPSRARASTLCAVCKAVIDEIDKSLTEEQRKSGEEAIEKHMFKYCDTAKGKDKTMVRASPADGPLPPAVLRSRRCH